VERRSGNEGIIPLGTPGSVEQSTSEGRGLQENESVGRRGAAFGHATSGNYRATFFSVSPELEGQVVVHHAVERQTLTKYPGLVSKAEIHSLENLRGIPKENNPEVHLSQIRREWNRFYRENPAPTKDQLLQKATEIDAKFGHRFRPRR